MGVLRNIWAYIALGASLLASVLFYRSRYHRGRAKERKRDVERLRASEDIRQNARKASEKAKQEGKKRVQKARKKARQGKRTHFTGDRWD